MMTSLSLDSNGTCQCGVCKSRKTHREILHERAYDGYHKKALLANWRVIDGTPRSTPDRVTLRRGKTANDTISAGGFFAGIGGLTVMALLMLYLMNA